MKGVLGGLAVCGTLVAASGTAAQTWSLEQNWPNPFCPARGATAIRFTTATTAEVLLRVGNPGETEIIRTLLDGVLVAGFHEVLWDGKDDMGATVPDGNYPYRLIAGSDPILFEDMKVAAVVCEPTSVDEASWGRIRSLYR